MKTFLFSLVGALLFAVDPITQSQAACWCGMSYCIGVTDAFSIVLV